MLKLTRIKRQNNLRHYCFEEYSRPDYLARSVSILVDEHFIIRAIRFNSALFGIAAVSYGRGVTESSGWEDETVSRALSGTANYYSVAGTVHQPALLDKVLGDTLAAAPSAAFREMVLVFTEHSDREMVYPYAQFRLEPIRTTEKIKILKYLPPERKDPAVAHSAPVVFRGMLRNLSPIYVVGRSYHSIVDSLRGIHYVCPACGGTNTLLARRCTGCQEPRPSIKWHTLSLFFLRALIHMSYFAYVLLTISFLTYTLFHLRTS